jgi:hypothetical protein
MTEIFTKKWIGRCLFLLRATIRNWRGNWRRTTINPLLFIKHDHVSGRVGVFRKRDGCMILSLTHDGTVSPFHHGFWSAEEAIAIGEALVILGLGYQRAVKLHESEEVFD